MSEKTLQDLLQIRMHYLWELDTDKDMKCMADRLPSSAMGEDIVTA
jgi:hypothetical protein